MKVAAGHARLNRIGVFLRREFIELAIISVYLYVWFGSLILFKTATLRAYGIGFAPYGIAAVKAVVLGKFILIGTGFNIGSRFSGKPLVHFLAYKVLIFAAFLFLLSLLEEAALDVLHGRPAVESLSQLGTWLQITASCILLCLVLTPYFGLKAIGDALGAGTLRRIFFGR